MHKLVVWPTRSSLLSGLSNRADATTFSTRKTDFLCEQRPIAADRVSIAIHDIYRDTGCRNSLP